MKEDGRIYNYENNTIEKNGVIVGFITNDDVPGQLMCGCDNPDVKMRLNYTSHESGLTLVSHQECMNCGREGKKTREPRFS